MGFFDFFFPKREAGEAALGASKEAQAKIAGVNPPPEFTQFQVPKAQEEFLLGKIGKEIPQFQGIPKTLIPALNAIIQQQASDAAVGFEQGQAARGLTRAVGSGPNAIGAAGLGRIQSLADQQKNKLFADIDLKEFENQQRQQEFFQKLGLDFGQAQARQSLGIADFGLAKAGGEASQILGQGAARGQAAQGQFEDVNTMIGAGLGIGSGLGIGGGDFGGLINFLRGGEGTSAAISGAGAGLTPGFLTGNQGMINSMNPMQPQQTVGTLFGGNL